MIWLYLGIGVYGASWIFMVVILAEAHNHHDPQDNALAVWSFLLAPLVIGAAYLAARYDQLIEWMDRP